MFSLLNTRRAVICLPIQDFVRQYETTSQIQLSVTDLYIVQTYLPITKLIPLFLTALMDNRYLCISTWVEEVWNHLNVALPDRFINHDFAAINYLIAITAELLSARIDLTLSPLIQNRTITDVRVLLLTKSIMCYQIDTT